MHILVRDKDDLETAFPLGRITLGQGASAPLIGAEPLSIGMMNTAMDAWRGRARVRDVRNKEIQQARVEESICSVRVDGGGYDNVIGMPLIELFARVVQAQGEGKPVVDLRAESGKALYDKWVSPPAPSVPEL